jgi:hypothetical protein
LIALAWSDGTVKLSVLWLGETSVVRYRLSMTTFQDPLYTGYRYPADLISYAGTVNLSSMELREAIG